MGKSRNLTILTPAQMRQVPEKPGACSPAEQMLQTVEEICHCRDLDTLLERILSEARRFTNADGGTIYLAGKTHLHFNFVQNDTLFKNQHAKQKYAYSRSRLPIDKKSIAGYVAATGRALVIEDVYHYKKDVSYAFNPAYDERAAYRTKSVLAVPIASRGRALLGVLQLINAKDKKDRVVPFTRKDALYIVQFAANAAYAIENAKLTREMAFRMVEIAALRDPTETNEHAERVSAIASELYLLWSKKHNVETGERRRARETLRIAAILHDVGKAAVSSALLKKPGKLTERERFQVRCHTVYGARLFVSSDSAWNRAAAEVALHHHEKWNGGGYPGKIGDLFAKKIAFGPGRKGSAIPLLARIVSIADVYDSLVSTRAYKKQWREEEARRFIRENAGKAFDPELVRLFLGMSDTVRAIEARFRKTDG